MNKNKNWTKLNQRMKIEQKLKLNKIKSKIKNSEKNYKVGPTKLKITQKKLENW